MQMPYANRSFTYNQTNTYDMTINYITFFTFATMFIVYRKFHRDASAKLDEEADTASDYTIKIKKFPNPGKDFDIDDEIKHFFENAENNNIEVTKVNLVYNLNDFNAKIQHKQQLIE